MATQWRVTEYSHGPRWPRAAVFDCDGLLVDSGECWNDAYRAVAADIGRSAGGLDFASFTGASIASAARHLSRALGVRVSERRLRRALVERFAAEPPAPMPGGPELVRALGERMPLAVASNAPLELVTSAVERVYGLDTFRAVLSVEQLRAHKPAPDVYLEACRRLGISPSDSIAFEDSPPGAQAARAAGLVVVAVPSVPGLDVDADLTVSRLDDPGLMRYLGLGSEAVT